MKAFGIAVALVICGSVALASNKTELPTKKITVDIKKAGVRSALEALFDNSGSKYLLSAEVTDDTKVDVEAIKMKWSDVFSKVIAQAGLSYSVTEDGTIEVTGKTASAPALKDGEPEPSLEE